MDNTINFRDILKKSFLEQFTYNNTPLTFERIVITLLITFAVGLFIFYIYKKTFNGVLYSKSFNISLVMVSLITALIIMPVTSNITLSLGMVGALSIVRFRTAIKDPIDIVFLFWGISVGIANGAGFFLVSIVGSLLIGLMLMLLSYFKLGNSTPYLLIIHYDRQAGLNVQRLLPRHTLKSKTVTGEGTELTVEIRLKNNNTSFMDELLKTDGVKDAVLMSYNGDYVS